MISLILKYTLVVYALGVQALDSNEECLNAVIAANPHTKAVYQLPVEEAPAQLIELKEATPFTIFVPTVEAVANLVKLFAADGCDAISKDVLSQIIKASVIEGKKIEQAEVTNAPEGIISVSADGIPYSLEVYYDQDMLKMGILDENYEVVDVVGMAGGARLLPDCPRGIVYIIDDIIIPPSLRAKLLNILNGDPGDGCPQELMLGGPEPPVPTSALLATTNITLEGDAKVTIPIEAKVNAEAVDENGNTQPIESTLSLNVDASLNELGTDSKGGCIQAEIPVSIQVNSQQGGGAGSMVTVPVDVDIDVELLVAGKPIGKGQASMLFEECVDPPGHIWDQCGGLEYDSKSKSRTTFTSGCEEGICVEKNKWFAMCMPEERRELFKKRGWSGKVLECR